MHPFSKELYDKQNNSAIMAVANYLGAKGHYCTFPENFSADISVLSPQDHEVQVMSKWVGEFKYNELHIHGRKGKLLKAKRPLWFWILNADKTQAWVFPKESVREDRTRMVYCAFLKKEELRYIVPKKEATLINLKKVNK